MNTAAAPNYRPHDWLTKKQAAPEFGVTERYLQHLRQKRLVPSYIIANEVRFKWIDLHTYFESQRTPAVTERRGRR